MNVNLELYRVFCEVVKYKNISKAAKAMYISQSAITQSIQKLESILGAKVFYRSKTGVELTEEGKKLYEYVNNSIETMNNAENIFSKYVNLESGLVRIGGATSLISSLIMTPLIEFIKKYPNIDFLISSGLTANLMQKLANGELDIVILNLPFKAKKYSNVETISLREAKYSFFATKTYLKKHPVKTVNDLEKCNLILPREGSSRRKFLDDYCKSSNINLKSNYEISSSVIIKNLVLNNIGVGFTNSENLKDIENNIQIVKEIKIDSAKEGIATLKKSMQNKATTELVKMIKEYYK